MLLAGIFLPYITWGFSFYTATGNFTKFAKGKTLMKAKNSHSSSPSNLNLYISKVQNSYNIKRDNSENQKQVLSNMQ